MAHDMQTVSEWLARMQEEPEPSLFEKLNFLALGRGFVGSAVSIEDALAWFEQFDPEDRERALGLLTCITYFSAQDVRNMCRLGVLRLRVEEQVDLGRAVFVPVGPTSKSGHLMAYFLRTSTSARPAQFLDQAQLAETDLAGRSAIVFLDDYLGTGRQFGDWWLEAGLAKLDVAQYYLALVATSAGCQNIRDRTRAQPIPVHERWDRRDLTTDVDRDFLAKYGAGLFSYKGEDMFDGFSHTAASVAFFHNVPNNTVPIIWSDQTNQRGQKWRPLLKRLPARKVRMSDAIRLVLEQAERADGTGDDEWSIFLAETVANMVEDATPQELGSVHEITQLVASASRVLGGLTHVGAIGVHPPQFAAAFVALRRRLIDVLGDGVIQHEGKEADRLLALAANDVYTIKQGTLIERDVSRSIQRVYRQMGEQGQCNMGTALLSALSDDDVWVSYCAFGCVLWLVNEFGSDRLDGRMLVPASTDPVQLGYYKRRLLAAIDDGHLAEYEAWLTPDREAEVTTIANLYGTIAMMSLAREKGLG